MVEKNEEVYEPLNEIFDRKLVLGKYWVPCVQLIFTSLSLTMTFFSLLRRGRVRDTAPSCRLKGERDEKRRIRPRGASLEVGDGRPGGNMGDRERRVIGVLEEGRSAGTRSDDSGVSDKRDR